MDFSEKIDSEKQIRNAILEFFKTEEEYSNHLTLLWHHFGKYFCMPHKYPKSTWNWSKEWTNSIVAMGFYQLRNIQLFSSTFVDRLREICSNFEKDDVNIENDLMSLCGYLSEKCENFIIYSTFITIFDTFQKAVGFLKISKAEPNHFREKEKEFQKENHRITDIGGLIILPTQRIARYPLFFEDIMKRSENIVSPKLFEKVCEVMYKFKGVTMLINEERSMGFLGEVHRDYKRLQLSEFNSPGREFRGWWNLERKGKSKERLVTDIVLFNDLIVFDHHGNGKDPRKKIDLKKVKMKLFLPKDGEDINDGVKGRDGGEVRISGRGLKYSFYLSREDAKDWKDIVKPSNQKLM